MKQKIKTRAALASALAALFLAISPASLTAALTSQTAQQAQQANVSAKDRQAIAAFEKRVKEYVSLRERLEDQMPKLLEKSTAEQIAAHKTAFEEIVRKARVGAKQGDIFTPGAMSYIRMTIRNEFKGEELRKLRESVLEADTKGVPLKVNYPYPEDKELTEIPATLLLKLPQLPKQVKYRFVNRNMLLVDRENGLIVDYMFKALP
jgi:K+-sensing histidine kinase KdpD